MSNIISLVNYHKYWIDRKNRVKNPKFDRNSALILSLKERDSRFDQSVNHFYLKVRSELQKHLKLKENIQAAIIPSAAAGQHSWGIGMIVKRLRCDYDIINKRNILNRTTTVPKLAHGGNRDISVHTESIQVFSDNVRDDVKTLLLDDVTTSGNSMYACKNLLENTGYQNIICIALAKTV